MDNIERGLVLLEGAQRTGALSEESLRALKKTGQLDLGSSVASYQSESVLLAATLIDDSDSLNVTIQKKDGKSITLYTSSDCPDDPISNTELVRVGYNSIVGALQDSQMSETIWFHSRYLKGYQLTKWGPVTEATLMDQQNYQPSGNTPLYDEAAVMFGSIIAKAQQFRNQWTVVHTATLIVSDGADWGSTKQTADSIKSIVTDMYRTGIHIVAAMGIDDGETDFRKVFAGMGIRDNLILTPGSTPDEIREAFCSFGRLASRAVNLEHFNDMLNGGFLALPSGEK